MQTVAAYLLEKAGLTPDQRQERIASVLAGFDTWLTDKGVQDPRAQSGAFESKSPDGGGSFTRDTVQLGADFIEEVVLQEKANALQRYITRVCVIGTEHRVAVYATVSAMNLGTTIAPVFASARCPKVVRSIIQEHRDWHIGDAAIPSGRHRDFSGTDGGAEVCRIVMSSHRKLPLVVVSEYENELVFQGLDRSLAFDLVGIAYVSSIDDAAAWELSRGLGRRNACFHGAVRLYWPNLGTTAEHVQSTIWTAERMLEEADLKKAEDRFRDQVRQRVMGAASFAISEPPEVAEIYRAYSRQRLTQLQGSADELQSVYALAQGYADEAIKAAREASELRLALEVMTTRAENAEVQLPYRPAPAQAVGDHDLDAGDVAEPNEVDAIQPNQVIFYKKTYGAPHHDLMVRRGDCGHNNWKTATAAPKAWKGVERLEGRNDWTSFLKCAECEGGGMWKVTW